MHLNISFDGNCWLFALYAVGNVLIITIVMMMTMVMMMKLAMVPQHIPTITKFHYGGNVSEMNN